MQILAPVTEERIFGKYYFKLSWDEFWNVVKTLFSSPDYDINGIYKSIIVFILLNSHPDIIFLLLTVSALF